MLTLIYILLILFISDSVVHCLIQKSYKKVEKLRLISSDSLKSAKYSHQLYVRKTQSEQYEDWISSENDLEKDGDNWSNEEIAAMSIEDLVSKVRLEEKKMTNTKKDNLLKRKDRVKKKNDRAYDNYWKKQMKSKNNI